VLWVNNTSIAINERCFFPIKILDYHDEIWCDVISMNIGYVVLGMPWLYDLNVTIFEWLNYFLFTFYVKTFNLLDYHQGLMIIARRRKK
jgi:hypothetical protein